jgi:hypothetical protein
MKRSIPFAALALLLLAGARANADFIEWSYNWDRNPVSVLSDSGNGSVAFTNEPLKNATGSSDTVATNLKASSLAPASAPDTLNNTGAYTLTLTLTDTASGATGSLTFKGKLGGTFSADSANITNTFLSPTTQTLFLGNNSYTVAIGPYSPPGPPDSINFGSIAAHVEVSSIVTAGAAPEPSTLLMGLFGLSGAGLFSWRKRRAAAAV